VSLFAVLAVLAPLALDVEICARGSVHQDGACVAVAIPQHAELDVDGRDFVCHRGYRREGNACAAFELPANAELDASGHDFRCRRGYQRAQDRCELLGLPANGKLDEGGNDWACRRGYQRRGPGCAALKVPENAVLDASGNDWACVRGYREQDDGSCTPVKPPTYAVLDDEGHGWTCKEGFKRVGDGCQPLSPAELQVLTAAAEEKQPAVASPAAPSPELGELGLASSEATSSEPDPTGELFYEVEGYCGGRYVSGLMFPVQESQELEGTLYSEEGGVMYVHGMRRPPDNLTITGFDETGNACMF